ncbi:hypothetical protein ERJ75_001761300 [Trypanosoma vivax]|nr:hypothetical protein ERJ75_001761300 [Trypanosoma vivax]
MINALRSILRKEKALGAAVTPEIDKAVAKAETFNAEPHSQLSATVTALLDGKSNILSVNKITNTECSTQNPGTSASVAETIKKVKEETKHSTAEYGKVLTAVDGMPVEVQTHQ